MASQDILENTTEVAVEIPAPSPEIGQQPVAGFRPMRRDPGSRRLPTTDEMAEIMDIDRGIERALKMATLHAVVPNHSTFASEARRLLISRMPHLEKSDLNIVADRTDWVNALMIGFLTDIIGILGVTAYMEDLADIQNLMKEHRIMKGWTCRLVGSGVVTHLIYEIRKRNGCVFISDSASNNLNEEAEFNECVFELWPPDHGGPLYFVSAQLHQLAECSDKSNAFIIYAREHTPVFHELMHESNRLKIAERKKKQKTRNTKVDITNGETIHLDEYAGWEDIVMSDAVRRSIHDDFSFFTSREAWFRRNRLPFKRGYLLVGPPGNGKTMIARAIASTPGFHAFTFDFTIRDSNTNMDLFQAFEKAANSAPAVFILEDIDRIFENHENTAVTKDGLLNCLDGVGAHEGVVVVATANHPEAIDPALLHRPGRFDRVIRVDNPDTELRYRQLRHLFSRASDLHVSDQVLRQVAEKSEGFSMADLKEIFVSAGCECCLEQTENIGDGHLLKAFETIKAQFSQTARSAGF